MMQAADKNDIIFNTRFKRIATCSKYCNNIQYCYYVSINRRGHGKMTRLRIG